MWTIWICECFTLKLYGCFSPSHLCWVNLNLSTVVQQLITKSKQAHTTALTTVLINNDKISHSTHLVLRYNLEKKNVILRILIFQLNDNSEAWSATHLHLNSNSCFLFIPPSRHSLPPLFLLGFTTLDAGSGPNITRTRPVDSRPRLRLPCATASTSTCSWWRTVGLTMSPWTLNRRQLSSRFWMQVRPELLTHLIERLGPSAFLLDAASLSSTCSRNQDGGRDGSRPAHPRPAHRGGGREGEGCGHVWRRRRFQEGGA